jgi:mannitol/fructose-specific phosphotransferase system IIA component (Ntr-type)
MPLTDIFGRELIKVNLESKSKDEVFEELVETIAERYPEIDRQEMFEAVISRENRMNTAILPGIAVPHGYCNAVGGIIGAAGFSREGIKYDSLEPVHAVFMLLMGESYRERHLRVLSRLLELFKSKSFAAIQAAESPQEVYDTLHQF